MKKIKVGDIFGYLKVIDDKFELYKGRRFYKCECQCGKITSVQASELKRGFADWCGNCAARIVICRGWLCKECRSRITKIRKED